MKEEPSYMMFARANVKQGLPTPAIIVHALLQRIDRLEAEKLTNDSAMAELDAMARAVNWSRPMGMRNEEL